MEGGGEGLTEVKQEWGGIRGELSFFVGWAKNVYGPRWYEWWAVELDWVG